MEVKLVNFKPERPLEVLYNLLYGGDGSTLTVEIKEVKDNDNPRNTDGNGDMHRCNSSNGSVTGTGIQEREITK